VDVIGCTVTSHGVLAVLPLRSATAGANASGDVSATLPARRLVRGCLLQTLACVCVVWRTTRSRAGGSRCSRRLCRPRVGIPRRRAEHPSRAGGCEALTRVSFTAAVLHAQSHEQVRHAHFASTAITIAVAASPSGPSARVAVRSRATIAVARVVPQAATCR
jgi:hypothetical protein